LNLKAESAGPDDPSGLLTRAENSLQQFASEPLAYVADALMLGDREIVEAFED
jgi:hypothetical protein